jgi:hypothetical protein
MRKFLRGCPGWGANPGPLGFINFLIFHHFTAEKNSKNLLKPDGIKWTTTNFFLRSKAKIWSLCSPSVIQVLEPGYCFFWIAPFFIGDCSQMFANLPFCVTMSTYIPTYVTLIRFDRLDLTHETTYVHKRSFFPHIKKTVAFCKNIF